MYTVTLVTSVLFIKYRIHYLAYIKSFIIFKRFDFTLLKKNIYIYTLNTYYRFIRLDMFPNPLEDDPEDLIRSFPKNGCRDVRNNGSGDKLEFIRPSFCIKCKMLTGHNTPSRLILLKNGRPAMSSFCWICRSRKIRFVTHRFYQTNTGKK